MNYEVIDNVLSEETFLKIKNNILCYDFHWKLSPDITDGQENLPISSSYYFTHIFWDGFYVEPQSQMFVPLMDRLKCNAMIRIKANLYPSTETIVHHNRHIDYEFPHKGALFFLNNNNGMTVLDDGTEIESRENRLLIFDPTKPHNSTTCTDDKCRVNVNFNFF